MACFSSLITLLLLDILINAIKVRQAKSPIGFGLRFIDTHIYWPKILRVECPVLSLSNAVDLCALVHDQCLHSWVTISSNIVAGT